MLPVSELNRMRRALVEGISERSAGVAQRPTRVGRPAIDPIGGEHGSASPEPRYDPELTVLCRCLAQLQTCAAAGIRTAYLDLEDIRGYADAVTWARAESEMEVFLATPRIQKAGEQGFFKLIERANPHGVLVRNTGAIAHFAALGVPMTGDFSLNVANPLTAQWFMQQGLARLTISYDLNVTQVLDLLHAAPPDWFELTIHQHMPMFHMEHCVFAAFMSNGSSFLDCGRPCEKHSVKLRDRVGMEHPLKADVGCRNTLFNAVAQTGARYFRDLHTAGLRRYRVELLEENEDEARRVLAAYRALLSGETNGEDLWRELKAQSQLGVTGGTLQAV